MCAHLNGASIVKVVVMISELKMPEPGNPSQKKTMNTWLSQHSQFPGIIPYNYTIKRLPQILAL
jgi:hypothetical protein